jgi:hypothetical protein
MSKRCLHSYEYCSTRNRIAKKQNQRKCSPTDEWIKKVWTHTQDAVALVDTKNDIWSFAEIWITWRKLWKLKQDKHRQISHGSHPCVESKKVDVIQVEWWSPQGRKSKGEKELGRHHQPWRCYSWGGEINFCVPFHIVENVVRNIVFGISK